MKLFITGATGFIGSALVPELIKSGHEVVGMTRSAEGAEALARLGAAVHHGTLENIESLKAGAAPADAVIHLAFGHDFSRFQANCEANQREIEAMGEVLLGTGKTFIGIDGVLYQSPIPGQAYNEDDAKPPSPLPRRSEEATLELANKGVRGIVIRLSQIHDTYKQGLVSFLVRIALHKGVSAYVGNGNNRWAAAHVSDTARLFRLALEQGSAGSKWHAVGEQGVAAKEIAEAIGQRLKVPVVSISREEAGAHFGLLSYFMMVDAPTANAKTRERLGWEPTGPSLIEDLNQLVSPL